MASQELRTMILRMSKREMRTYDIAKICGIDPGEVVLNLAQEDELSSMVKRLMKDPADFCCPISHALFDDPVVAADGSTYERQSIEKWFAMQRATRSYVTSPLTGAQLAKDQLFPNQDMKFRIMSFKDETVAEIRCVAPLLLRMETFDFLQQLLRRAKGLVKHLGEDPSVRKTMFKLHIVWMKLPFTDFDSAAEVCQAEANVIKVLVEASGDEMHCLLDEIEEPELRGLLSDLDEDMIQSLHHKMKESRHVCQDWIDQELARRLVKRLEDDEVFTKLWDLLHHKAALSRGEDSDWGRAAGIVLARFTNRVRMPLKDLDPDVLGHAVRFIENQGEGIDFVSCFFRCKFQAFNQVDQQRCPPESAWIYMELASLASTDEGKLGLLLKANRICESDASIRRALIDHLHWMMLDSGSASISAEIDAEELFLRLISKENGRIPADLIPKLTLTDKHLQHFKGDLLVLAKQLGQANRHAEGSRLAVRFAKGLAGAKGRKTQKAEEDAFQAFLFAFQLDEKNGDAANALLPFATRVLAASRLPMAKVSLQAVTDFEKSLLMDWDLTVKDFTRSTSDQGERSPKFRISKHVTAWITLFPHGPNPRCTLNLSKAAEVRVQVQAETSTQLVETCEGMKFRDFVLHRADLQGHITIHAVP